jgi:hypothetical protein
MWLAFRILTETSADSTLLMMHQFSFSKCISYSTKHTRGVFSTGMLPEGNSSWAMLNRSADAFSPTKEFDILGSV